MRGERHAREKAPPGETDGARGRCPTSVWRARPGQYQRPRPYQPPPPSKRMITTTMRIVSIAPPPAASSGATLCGPSDCRAWDLFGLAVRGSLDRLTAQPSANLLVPPSRSLPTAALAIARALLYMRAHSTGGFSLFLTQGTAPVAGFSPPNW